MNVLHVRLRTIYTERKPCTLLMEESPLIVDKNIGLSELSDAVVAAGARHLSNGFIVTDRGAYLGVGTGYGLMREITQMQIAAARYANPLTFLPGNVPIDQHIDRLLANQIRFCACYCDLDAFKSFNDVYGYRKGDEVIQFAAQVVATGVRFCNVIFVGHIGGDDFIILFQSCDWEQRCQVALNRFAREVKHFFKPEHLQQNGYVSIDRIGQQVIHSLLTLSIGAIQIEPGMFSSHHEISRCSYRSQKAGKVRGGEYAIYRTARQAGKAVTLLSGLKVLLPVSVALSTPVRAEMHITHDDTP